MSTTRDTRSEAAYLLGVHFDTVADQPDPMLSLTVKRWVDDGANYANLPAQFTAVAEALSERRAQIAALRSQLENVLDGAYEGTWMARALDAKRERDSLSRALARVLRSLPEHKGELTITHNNHRSTYRTIEQLLGDVRSREFDDPDDWVSPDEREKAIATDELWEVQWYPSSPVGFNVLRASTLEALLAALEKRK